MDRVKHVLTCYQRAGASLLDSTCYGGHSLVRPSYSPLRPRLWQPLYGHHGQKVFYWLLDYNLGLLFHSLYKQIDLRYSQ